MPESQRRVVITGLGVVSPIGTGIAAFGTAIRAGTVGTREITSFDVSGFPYVQAGEVPDFDPAAGLSHLDPNRWGRSSLFAAVAARQAVTDSGIDPELLSRSAAGSIMGTTGGETIPLQQLTEQWYADGYKSLDGRLVRQVPLGQIAAAVNTELRLDGEAQTVPTACGASNFALGYAYDLVRTGEADFILAGGAESVNRAAHAGFYSIGALAPQSCLPFDKDRAGTLSAEGGVALFVEPLASAQARGARIYAEVLGYGMNCDARHMVNPDSDSIADCIRLAHQAAGVTPADIDYICAHGTGTPTNDATEATAVRAVFGARIPPMSSIKSMLGHSFGAASGFGAAACCLALSEGFLPPTANLSTLDPRLGAGLDPVPGTARPATPAIVENHGFAFGGNNAVVILGAVR
ncbi:beta-ketoacyl-[acyl-carrier-protein] synthase family protein [Nocardia sp. CA-120079]|uniref:beta-ketoacyl-[acyl-carrier-protein] synthase family protein n=1 Tax=Nocardia sp. CA-120079 TaxID=3239974 RepID=UPI003D9654C2